MYKDVAGELNRKAERKEAFLYERVSFLAKI